jgi:germination protein M
VRTSLRAILVVGFLAATSCGGGGDTGSTTSAASSVPANTSTTTITTTAPATTAPATTASTTTLVTTTQATTTTEATTTTSASSMVDVKLYLLRDGRLVIAHRQVPGPAVLRGALTELLAGPTADEQAAGLTTEVPAGTELNSVNLADKVATVDVTSPFATAATKISAETRVAQMVFTATQFANVEQVTFHKNGAPLDAIAGVSLTAAQDRPKVSIDVAGSVIFDSPAYGSTVHRTFTVTGEGFVYEGQFPIEVWSGDKTVGGVAPVTTGSIFNKWDSFSATITLDTGTPAGAISVVGYDPGGCGTEPECPPIVKTTLPLTYAP